MRRVTIAAVVAVFFLTACTPGPAAPEIGVLDSVCNDAFCVDVPQGWEAEIGETHMTFNHSLNPNHTFLTVGVINMRAIVEISGSRWPLPPQDVARSFWVLLEESGVAHFERSERVVGGAIKSWGVHDDGRMWHLMYPVEGIRAIGIEMRAPNDSWEAHADIVFESLTVSE